MKIIKIKKNRLLPIYTRLYENRNKKDWLCPVDSEEVSIKIVDTFKSPEHDKKGVFVLWKPLSSKRMCM